MKKVIYTCNTGGYDALRQPLTVRPDWDYVCLTDDPSAGTDGAWQLRATEGPDAKNASRRPKMLPHEYLSGFDVSLYVDSNLIIEGDAIYDAADAAIASGALWAGVKHPQRDCIYDELRKCYLAGHCRWRDAIRLKLALCKEAYPRHAGLLENNIIFRRHNAPEVILVDEQWWDRYSRGIKRDQLHLMPVLRGAGISAGTTLPSLQRTPHAHGFSSPHPRPRVVKNILKRFI